MQNESIVLIFIAAWICSSEFVTGFTFNLIQRTFTKANQSCALYEMIFDSKQTLYLHKPEYRTFPVAGRFWLGNKEYYYRQVCPQHWMYNPATKSCYSVFLDNTIISHDAERSCDCHNASLTNIENKEEQYFLYEVINAQTPEGFTRGNLWTAGTESKGERLLKWNQTDQHLGYYLERMEGQQDGVFTYKKHRVASGKYNYNNDGNPDGDNRLNSVDEGYICKKTVMGSPRTRRFVYIDIKDGVGRYRITDNTTLKMGYVCANDPRPATHTVMNTGVMAPTATYDDSNTTYRTGKPRPPIVIDRDISGTTIAISIGIMIPVLIIIVCLTAFLVRRKYIKPRRLSPSVSMAQLQDAGETQSNQHVNTILAISGQGQHDNAYDSMTTPIYNTYGAAKSPEVYTELSPSDQRARNVLYTELCPNGTKEGNACTEPTGEHVYYSACV